MTINDSVSNKYFLDNFRNFRKLLLRKFPAIRYSFELFSVLLHPPALPLTAAESVCLLQTAPPTQVAVVTECDDCHNSLCPSA